MWFFSSTSSFPLPVTHAYQRCPRTGREPESHTRFFFLCVCSTKLSTFGVSAYAARYKGNNSMLCEKKKKRKQSERGVSLRKKRVPAAHTRRHTGHKHRVIRHETVILFFLHGRAKHRPTTEKRETTATTHTKKRKMKSNKCTRHSRQRSTAHSSLKNNNPQ